MRTLTRSYSSPSDNLSKGPNSLPPHYSAPTNTQWKIREHWVEPTRGKGKEDHKHKNWVWGENEGECILLALGRPQKPAFKVAVWLLCLVFLIPMARIQRISAVLLYPGTILLSPQFHLSSQTPNSPTMNPSLRWMNRFLASIKRTHNTPTLIKPIR